VDKGTHCEGPSKFDELIAPVSRADFLAAYWEQQPLHCRRDDAQFYQSLLSTGDIEAILSSGDLRFPALQLSRNGSFLGPETYTRTIKHGSEVFNAVPDLHRVQAEYQLGATIVLPALHRTWPGLRDLCRSLDAEFNHPSHANAYLTPGNAVGFTPHYDTHEVFVLQLQGTKHWRVYNPPLKLPHRTQPFHPPSYRIPAQPDFEVTLSPGDLLYLPRGFVHTAETGPGHSVHVTIGMTVYTWIELVSELLASAPEWEILRRALPAGFADPTHPRADLARGLAERVSDFARQANYERLVEKLAHKVRAAPPGHPHPIRLNVGVAGAQTVLETPAPGQFVLASENGQTTLLFSGRVLKMPGAIRKTLDAICAARRFRAADLPQYLDEGATLAFVRYLQSEGFLSATETFP